MNGIRAIFFDMGSTLVDESECLRLRCEKIAESAKVTYDEVLDYARNIFDRSGAGFHAAAEHYGVPLPKWNKEDERLYPDSAEVLCELKNRGYVLGVVANQSPGSAERLERWGIEKYFDVIASSAEAGFAKPDRRIFELALDGAGVLPENSAMVGDRLDNDIRPANALGMTTVLIRQGPNANAVPADAAEAPDIEIQNLRELLDIFK